jgi:drug/metabolite transporter (DMT)-like permease
MYSSSGKKSVYTGIGLAIVATLVWSGNFIIARGVIKDIPPVSLAFFRWLSATIIILPFAWKYFTAELKIVRSNFGFLLLAAVTGISLFNTFVYIAGHYSTAINMALLGTCTSPVMSVILARIFLKERITWLRIAGMCICITGVLFLLSNGSIDTLLNFSFTFAIYNTMVKKKPVDMNPVNFLFVIFGLGTVILLPFYLFELKNAGGFEINLRNLSSILYLGLGASVFCFLVWNKAIRNLGAGRTALFGNLIPVFSSIEAVILLHEKITSIHLISFILVAAGLVIANMKK